MSTICAISTAPGVGGIAVIRVSGTDAFALCDKIFHAHREGHTIQSQKAYTLQYGTIENERGETVDNVVIAVFRAPHSFTGEDTVEISCHGSIYIQQQILQLLIQNGCELAKPGEFTQRAFLNGKMDLSQAEAVADLIASTSAGQHRLAMSQMRGGFSRELKILREKLLHITSLMELELDFADHEELEFADRHELKEIAAQIEQTMSKLIHSFKAGNAIKNGIPVAIVGETNAGKSTLLNALLNEEKAIVSDIHGTTRDIIEDTVSIQGQIFRFIDTAGLRQSEDKVEQMGIERTLQKMRQARVWLYMFDASTMSLETARAEVGTYVEKVFGNEVLVDEDARPEIILIANKVDVVGKGGCREGDVLYISAKQGLGLELLEDALQALIPVMPDENVLILSNARHYEALGLVQEDLRKVETGLDSGLPGDLLAMDIRSAIDHLGLITGKILADDILGTVFSKFCIGK